MSAGIRTAVPRGHGQRKVGRLPVVSMAGPDRNLCPPVGAAKFSGRWKLLDNELKQRLTGSDKRKFLFLERHATLPLQWQVESFDPTYLERLDGVISAYDTVTVFGIHSFMERADEQGYEVVFLEDPAEEMQWLASLSNPVGVSIDSDLEGTTEEGFFPFQAQGINFAKGRRGVYFNHSTGLGKSTVALGMTEWYMANGLVDLVLSFVKTSNKINTERGIERLWGKDMSLERLWGKDMSLDPRCVIVDGTLKKREKQYIEVVRSMQQGEVPILITNHEKLRDDKDALMMLVEGKRVLVLFDEMSAKLSNHETSIYKSAVEVFYTSHTSRTKTKKVKGKTVKEKVYSFYPKAGSERPSQVYFAAFSATPIEHNPGQFFNQIHFMDPSVYGSRQNFTSTFGRGKDFWGNQLWDLPKLPLVGLMALDVIHQVDKKDPDIASFFPEVLPPETVYLDMSPGEAYLYDALLAEYEAMRDADASILDETEILAAINVLELICCNPIAVLESAKRYQQWLDDGGNPDDVKGSKVAWKLREHIGNDKKFDVMPTKATTLIDTILSSEDDKKFVVFTSLNDALLPHLSKWLDEAEIEHVVYHGGLTTKQRQAAEDAFQNDPSVRVFLSSDAGSDSINLHAAGDVTHYNDPWKWSTKEQRTNRINRIVSTFIANQERTLRFAGTFEDRKEEVIAMKKGYHDSILRNEVAEQAQQLRRGDFMYVMFGGDRE